MFLFKGKSQKQHDNIELLNPFVFKFLDKGNNNDLKYNCVNSEKYW